MDNPFVAKAPALQLETNPGKVESFGKRTDGTAKGQGYFGTVKRLDNSNNFSSELSTDDPVEGKSMLHPLMVPTLSHSELSYLLDDKAKRSKQLEGSIYDKAATHASTRLKSGLSVWAMPGEQFPLPTP